MKEDSSGGVSRPSCPFYAEGHATEQKANGVGQNVDRPSGFVSFFQRAFGTHPGNQLELDDLAELYVKAGNSYKAGKHWDDAGRAYGKAAKVHMDAGEPDEAARYYGQAASTVKRTNPQQAVEWFEKAINLLIRAGRFSTAASHERDCAEMLEKELNEPGRAVDYYRRAADRFFGENAPANANGCLVRVAHLLASQGKYTEAAKQFEELALSSQGSSVTSYNTRGYLFKALLCVMADIDNADLAEIQTRFNKAVQLEPGLVSSQEGRLLQSLIETLDKEDLEEFMGVLADYTRIAPFDAWHNTLIIRTQSRFEPDLK